MSKKTKKRSVSVSTKPAVAAAAPSVGKVRAHSAAAEFNPDYSYVKTDLKRIGILAGSFFVILVVLSFFLR
jgi:hypothetical protein